MTRRPTLAIETPLGAITVSLAADAAPITVANFLTHVDAEVFSSGHFYRTVTPENQPNDAIRISVIQGGIRNFNTITDPAPTIPLEGTSTTGLHHLDGTISMARVTPDSATTEFFICVGNQPELDFGGRRNPDGLGFAAFGQVTGGMDVVHAINQAPRHEQQLTPDVPITAIRRVE